MEVLTPQEAIQQTTTPNPSAPPRLDELAIGTLIRAIDAGLYGGELRLLLWLLELDCSERAAHRGTFAWFNAYAKTAAEALGSVPHRIRERMRNLKGQGWLYFIHGTGEFRTWIRHNNEPPPSPDAPIPRPADPQRRLFDGRQALDAADVRTVHLDTPGDAPDRQAGGHHACMAYQQLQGGLGRQLQRRDDGESQPADPPDDRGTDHDGPRSLSQEPPPSPPEEGERPFSAHQLGAHQLGAHQLGAHQLGAHQLGAHQLGAHQLGARRSDSDEDDGEGVNSAHACGRAPSQEDIYISSSSSSESEQTSAHRLGAHQLGARLTAAVHRLAATPAESIAWNPACKLAKDHVGHLRPNGSDERYSLWRDNRRCWRLLLFAALIEAEMPELADWVRHAAADVRDARQSIRTTPGAFFRGCLAMGLEYRGCCAKDEGMHLLGRLQHALTHQIRWFECRQQLRQETNPNKLAEAPR